MTAAPPISARRDIVVIGSSAGGVEALPLLLAGVPEDFTGTICIVQHMAATRTPMLVDILARSTALPVRWAEQGAKLSRGHIFVAPPDSHLLFSDEHLVLSRGPRENHARPSIDKLFRSAAAQHDGRVIGVLLTGMLDDGVAGLRAIASAGGLTIVQDPQTAAYPELPSEAVAQSNPDHVLSIVEIGAKLGTLTRESSSHVAIPRELSIEAAIDHGSVEAHTLSELGPQSPVACPDCQGPTWLLGDEEGRRYRCYLGHVNTAREVLERGTAEVEHALWSAVRALGDRAAVLESIAQDSAAKGRGEVAAIYEARAKETRAQAELARKFLLDMLTTRP